MVGDDVEAGNQLGADRGETSGQTAGGAGAGQVANVDAVVGDVGLGQPGQPALEQARPACAVAPFWPANSVAAPTKVVVTSHATTTSMPRSRALDPMARSAPSPPSVVADPPTATTMWRGAALDRGEHEFAGAVGRGVERVVVLGTAGQ